MEDRPSNRLTGVDRALEMRSQSSSVATSELVVHSFADVIQEDNNAMFVGGRRVSGVRRTRYSQSEHSRKWRKVGLFVLRSLKLLVLLILYFVVKHFSVS